MLPDDPVDGSLDEDLNYEEDEAEVPSVLPEVVVLPLPSNIISFKLKSSLLTDVNQSKSTKQSTQAWASVQNAQSQIFSHANCYQRAWQALKCIGTPEDLSVYKKLDKKDLVITKDISMAKHFGQGSDTLDQVRKN